MTPTRLVVAALVLVLCALAGAPGTEASAMSSGGDCAYVGSDPSVNPDECLYSGGDDSSWTQS